MSNLGRTAYKGTKWAAAWDMCRDGEMAARDYVRLVLSGISSVADVGVVRRCCAGGHRGAPVRRPRLAGDRAGPDGQRAARHAPDGARRARMQQLAYVRAFAGVASSAEDLALLAELLEGSVRLDGLTVDTDLRWALLARLVSRDRAGVAEIDDELARDATDAGERHAADPAAPRSRRPRRSGRPGRP